MEQPQPDHRGKIYHRTEDGTETLVTVREALAEVNDAMMGRVSRERSVRTMHSSKGQHHIVYADGRTVTLLEIDAPSDMERAEWATTHAGKVVHRFDTTTHRARCSSRYMARQYSRDNGYGTLSGYQGGLYRICPKCTAGKS